MTRPLQAHALRIGVGNTAAARFDCLSAQKWAVRVLVFITIAALTRLATLAGFGAVAVSLVVLSLIFLLADMGFAAYPRGQHDQPAKDVEAVIEA
ncbi:MAG: hypothetical protein ABW091_15795 [Microbacterium sp.]